MGIFNMVDDRTLDHNIIMECGYEYLDNTKIYLKQIAVYTASFSGLRASYIRLHKYPNWMFGEDRFYIELNYITSHGDNRIIRYPDIYTVSELYSAELWAKSTTDEINQDRISGTYNWPKYEVRNIW